MLIKTPSKELLNTLNREIIDKDEYAIRHLSDIDIDYVIDIGANIGVFSRYVNDILDIRKGIICLEPQINNFVYLQVNTSGMSNVRLYNTALGNGNDMYLTTTPKNEGMYQCKEDNVSEEVVKSITLPSIISDNNIKPEDVVLMKCDCEGGEVALMNNDAMEYMKYFLQISLEVHYGDKYFEHCPSKDEYKGWLETFVTHSIYSQNWKSDKNGRVILRRM